MIARIIRLVNIIQASEIGKDSIKIYIIQFISLGIGMIGSIITARVLGPSAKGIVDLFNLLNSFIVDFGLLGVGSGLLYYLANRNEKLKNIHGTGIAFCLVLGTITAMIGFVAVGLWERIFPGLSKWMILLVFSLAPFAYYRLIWSNIMTGLNKAVDSFRLNLVFSAISLAIILFLYITEQISATTIIIISSAIAVATAIAGVAILFKVEPKLDVSVSLGFKTLKYGLTNYVGVVANIINFRIDQLMINFWLGTTAVGLYAVSVRWAELLFLLDGAIISAALFRVSSLPNRESYNLTKRLHRVQIVISGSSGLLLALIAYPLIMILYGAPYKGSALPLVLLIPGVVFWSVSKILSVFISYNRGKVSWTTYCAIFGCFLNIILNWFFIKVLTMGINGAAIASSISYSVVCIITFLLFNMLSKKVEG